VLVIVRRPNLNQLTSSRTIIVVPAGTFRVIGVVREVEPPAAPVYGARVDVVPEVSGLSATTDAYGNYRLYGVPPGASIRATKAGYEPRVVPLTVANHQSVNLSLALAGARLGLAGNYTLTVAADSCTGAGNLPGDLRTRTYAASIAQSGGALTVTLSGANFRVNSTGRGNRFQGRADAAGATFTLGPGSAYYYFYYGPSSFPDVVEQLPDSTHFVVSGTADTSATPSGLSGALNGSLQRFDSRFPSDWFSLGECTSPTLRFTLSR
jgi:hypothetical protein